MRSISWCSTGLPANALTAIARFVLITRDVETVRQHATDGFAIYAFSDGRKALESHGFRFEPIQLSAVGTPSTAAIDMSPLPTFPSDEVTFCQDIGNAGWQDLTNLARDGRVLVRLDNYRPFDSVVVLYIGQQSAIGASPLLAASHGPEVPSTAVTMFHAADSETRRGTCNATASSQAIRLNRRPTCNASS